MRTRDAVIVALAAALAVGGCAERGDDDRRAPPVRTTAGAGSPEGTPSFDVARALIDTDEGSVLIDVELAATPEQRMAGLMHRESLPEDAGMAFVYFEETSGGFWMKDTLIPLSIAFFDEHGEILRILDMDPCRQDPCPIYDPGVPYWGALEVNQGSFEEWGVDEGDRIHIQ